MIEYHNRFYTDFYGDIIGNDEWKQITWNGTELHFTADTTDEDIIEWMEDNIRDFKYQRLMEMMKHGKE